MLKRKLIHVVGVCVFLAGCSEPEHRIFIPEGKNFSIVMPCQPKTQSESSTFKDYIVQSRIYRCHGLKYAYVVTYSEYPIDVYKEYSAEELLAGVVKRLEYVDPPFEFISKKTVDIDGVKGVQVNSRILSPRALYKSIIFYADDGIYQVAYSAKKDVFESPKADAFFVSMKFGK